jgi:hypothetical protein
LIILLLALAVLSRLPFLLQAGNILDFDEATFALMAKRVLEGEIPVYVSGHSYSGSFISFLIAPFLAGMGHTPLAVKSATLLLFLIFLSLNYFLLKRLFSKPVSVFGTLILIVMPAGVLDISLRAWGGHAELWSFWAAGLLLLSLYFDPGCPRKWPLLFGLGLIAGAGVWIGEIFVLFFLPSLLYWIGPGKIRDFVLVKNKSIPAWLRRVLLAAHAGIAIYLAVQLTGFFLNEHFGGQPPFRIKELKKIAVFLIAEATALWMFASSGRDERRLKMNRAAVTAAGFALGHLPAILFNALGGAGLRIFHKSGTITGAELPARLSDVFARKIPGFVLGLSYLPEGWGLALPALIMVIVAVTAFYGSAPARRIYYGIAIFTILANLASTLEASRYLAPLYLALAGILGIFLGEIAWKKSGPAAVLLALLILSAWGYSDYAYYREVPKNRLSSYRQILDYLEGRGIRGGQGSRSVTHLLTFLSGEKIVFSTYLQPERYPPHARYTERLWRRAYVFGITDSGREDFEKDAALFAGVTDRARIGDFAVYIVELPENQKTGIDLSYPEWRARPRPRLYLNQ